MVSFTDLFEGAWGKYITPGVPSSGKKNPPKTAIAPIGVALDERFAALQTVVDAGQKPVFTLDLATTTNITLSGEQTIDGTLTSNSKVMVKNHADPTKTGPYISAAGAWPRMSSFDDGEELFGQPFYIKGGSANIGRYFGLQATTAPNVGADAMVFDEIDKQNVAVPSALDALRGVGSNIATASTIDLDAATGDLLHLTGTTTVTAVTLTNGRERFVIVDDGCTVIPSATLIGWNAGEAMQANPNDLVLAKAAGGVVYLRRLAEGVSAYELDGDDIGLFIAHDKFGQALFASLRHSDGGFVMAGNDTSMLSPIEWEDDIVKHASGVDRYGQPVSWTDVGGGFHTFSGDIYPGGGGGFSAFDASEIAAFDGEAMAASALVKTKGNPLLQKFMASVCHVIMYGQSLSQDAVGHWIKQAAQIHDALMLGNSLHSLNAASSLFNPAGGSATLNAYVPTVLNAAGNALVANQAALDPTPANRWLNGAYGSDSATGFADMAKFLWLQRQALASDSTRKFVMTATGRGGRNVLQLSKGTAFFDRTVSGAGLVKAAQDASCLIAALIAVGEANVGEGTSYADYYSQLRQLLDDIDTDISTGVYGQARKPIKMLHQTSGGTGSWVNDTTNLAVQMAQLDMAENFSDVVCVGPLYRYSAKSDGHKDGNGYLWKGSMEAKVFDKTNFGGEGWQPLKITKARRRTNEIILSYNVPAPPIKFDDVLAGFTPTTYSKRGFKVTDLGAGGAEIGIVGTPEIVGKASIRLTLASVPTGTPRIWYAGSTTTGRGNVFDSDPTVSIFNYTYDAGNGDDASANIASMVGKPFPLNNAACVQYIDAVAA
ncbi:hypothetical protein ACSBOB_01510 [Mesorhizobium sp. ASY16-5R]|uniref:hypothetical protein n=1 Tax=Mesorhizobium sp. ASY16-5R TaxID=3445772 RepID=UPI003FA1172C